MTLYIFKYNNYYNRILKKEETLEEYGDPIFTYEPQSFNPNDGVNTQVLVGDILNIYSGEGDYIVLEEEGKILSRWFIIETSFESSRGQWKLTLRRDLLVDFYDDYINTDCFIEKATVSYDDPLIYNEEDMSFNQIKTEETLLTDRSGMAWIVGYYAKDTPDSVLTGAIDYTQNIDTPYISLDVSSIYDWEFYGYSEQGLKINPFSGSYNTNVIYGLTPTARARTYEVNINTGNVVVKNPYTSVDLDKIGYIRLSKDIDEGFANAYKAYGLENIKSDFINYVTYGNTGIKTDNETFEKLLTFPNGSIVKTGDGKYYNLTIRREVRSETFKISPKASNLSFAMEDIANGMTDYLYGAPLADTFSITVNYDYIYINTEERKDLSATYDMSESKALTENASYNIFAIPYAATEGGFAHLEYEPDASTRSAVYMDRTLSLSIASAIIKNFDDRLYDIQLLPYCPIQEFIRVEGIVSVPFGRGQQVSYVKDKDNNIIGMIFNVSKSDFSFDLQYEIKEGATTIDKKINNQCDKYRLCSPNFNSYFDFSVEKNGGVQYFNVDCSYKPYQPYIHVNPNFGGLYGQDFNDPRGLICGGDFSLTQIKDSWISYQLQNKNFQEMFGREIQNMEIQNKYQKLNEKLQAGVGAVTGAAAGGVITGSPFGAIAGGLLSAYGGLGDIAINDQLRAEAMDYKKDMFNYQLGNIQALPNTLTKVSSFNTNNKIFPLLEYYTCTEKEKDIFAKKLAYNSMTVMAIDKPSNYLDNEWSRTLSDGSILENKGYIKGQIIRIDTLEDEFHLLKSISDEFYKGVYIK